MSEIARCRQGYPLDGRNRLGNPYHAEPTSVLNIEGLSPGQCPLEGVSEDFRSRPAPDCIVMCNPCGKEMLIKRGIRPNIKPKRRG